MQRFSSGGSLLQDGVPTALQPPIRPPQQAGRPWGRGACPVCVSAGPGCCVDVCEHVRGTCVGGHAGRQVPVALVCAQQTWTTVQRPHAAGRPAPTAPAGTSVAATLATGSAPTAAAVTVRGGERAAAAGPLGWPLAVLRPRALLEHLLPAQPRDLPVPPTSGVSLTGWARAPGCCHPASPGLVSNVTLTLDTGGWPWSGPAQAALAVASGQWAEAGWEGPASLTPRE